MLSNGGGISLCPFNRTQTDLRVSNEVNFVLEDENVFQFHDLNGSQVL